MHYKQRELTFKSTIYYTVSIMFWPTSVWISCVYEMRAAYFYSASTMMNFFITDADLYFEWLWVEI